MATKGGGVVASRPKLIALTAAARELYEVMPYSGVNTAVPYLLGICVGMNIEVTKVTHMMFISMDDFKRVAARVREANARA